jgi:hypothetical protein
MHYTIDGKFINNNNIEHFINQEEVKAAKAAKEAKEAKEAAVKAAAVKAKAAKAAAVKAAKEAAVKASEEAAVVVKADIQINTFKNQLSQEITNIRKETNNIENGRQPFFNKYEKLLKLYDAFKGNISNKMVSALPAGQVLYKNYLNKLDIDIEDSTNAYTEIKLILDNMQLEFRKLFPLPEQDRLPIVLRILNTYINTIAQEKATQSVVAQVIYDMILDELTNAIPFLEAKIKELAQTPTKELAQTPTKELDETLLNILRFNGVLLQQINNDKIEIFNKERNQVLNIYIDFQKYIQEEIDKKKAFVSVVAQKQYDIYLTQVKKDEIVFIDTFDKIKIIIAKIISERDKIFNTIEGEHDRMLAYSNVLHKFQKDLEDASINVAQVPAAKLLYDLNIENIKYQKDYLFQKLNRLHGIAP